MAEENEEMVEETAPEEPPATAAPEPFEHVAVGVGETCPCSWEFGDDGAHIVTFGAMRNEPLVIAPMKRQMKPSDPDACAAVRPLETCPKCGWNSSDPTKNKEPHAILAK